MAKLNKEAVKDYHLKLREIKVRFPRENEELNIPNYSEIIKKQAAMLGCSVNEYILNLIEINIQNDQAGLHDENFKIMRGVKESK